MLLERFMTKEWASRFSRICTALVLIIGCSETAYWVWHARGGADVLPFLSEMSGNTSVIFILCGIALSMIRREGLLPWVMRCGCAVVILAVGVWTLLEYFNFAPFLIDQWIFSSTSVAAPFAERMSFNSAIDFVIAGIVLVYVDIYEARNGSALQILNWLIIGVAGIPLIGALYGAESLYAFWHSKAMAPLTSVAFILFSIAIFFHFSDKGLLAAFSDRGMSGRMIRRTLPMALLIPILMEWLETTGENAGIFSAQTGSAAMAVATAGLLVVVVFRNAKSLLKLDSERDLALQMLALGEQRLQTILDNTPAVICIKDRKGRYMLVNRHYETLFHIRNQDIVGKTDKDRFPIEQARTIFQNDKAVLEHGVAMEFEEVVTHPDGTVHHYLSAKFPIWDPMTNADVVCGISLDITQRKEAEDRVRELAKLKGEFASIVSHELRSPMTVIQGEVELVEDGVVGPVTPDQKHHLEVAIRSMDRLNRLITDVLDFQKLETGQMGVVTEPNNVVAIVSETIEGFRAVVAKKGIELRVDLPPNLPIVMCDKDAMVEVLTNLIDNAIKYTDAGYVAVSAKALADHVEIDISDSGVGIPKEEQGKLFQAFSRINTKGRTAVGTGLGLAICKRIVENNGGTIGVTSQAGTGSTFFFTVPVARKTVQRGMT